MTLQTWSIPTKRNVDLIPTVTPCSSSSIRTDFFTNKIPCTVLDGYVDFYFKRNFSAPWRWYLVSLYLSWYTVRFWWKRKRERRCKMCILILQCHPAVTKRKDSKFHHWHASWISTNGTDIQHRLCQDWLMGRYENLIPHRTRVITDNDQTRSPYRQYNRFRVERLLQSDLLTETCV